MRLIMLALLLCVSCAETQKLIPIGPFKPHKPDVPNIPTPPEPPTVKDDLPEAEDLSSFQDQMKKLYDRLPEFLEQGQVVSRTQDSIFSYPDNFGDSKLFSGIALASLPCDVGRPVLKAILDSINARQGAIVRYEILDGYQDNQTSLDQVTGVMLGLTERARKCPDDKPAIQAAWQLHRNFVAANDGRMAPVVKDYGTINSPGFKYGWELAGYILGVNDKPSDGDAAATELEMMGMIEGIKEKKAGCYNVHVALLTIIMAAKNGYPIARATRYAICEEMKSMDIPLADWYCDRQSASVYLQGFHLNEWHYRHQRCGAWDSADGNNEFHPGVDAMLEYEMARQ